MAYRFKVTATPYRIKKIAKSVPIGTVRGYTTVSRKTANVIKKYKLENSFRYGDSGHVLIDSARLPVALKKKVGFAGRTVGLHRLAYYVETGKKLRGFRQSDSKVGSRKIVDHFNRIRDDNRASNLRTITGLENIKRIPKAVKRAGTLRANVNIQRTSLGKYKNTAAVGAATKRETYTKERWREFNTKRNKSIGDTKSFYKKLNQSGASARNKTLATPESRAKKSAAIKAVYAKKPASYFKARAAKRIATLSKKYGSYEKYKSYLSKKAKG